MNKLTLNAMPSAFYRNSYTNINTRRYSKHFGVIRTDTASSTSPDCPPACIKQVVVKIWACANTISYSHNVMLIKEMCKQHTGQYGV